MQLILEKKSFILKNKVVELLDIKLKCFIFFFFKIDLQSNVKSSNSAKISLEKIKI